MRDLFLVLVLASASVAGATTQTVRLGQNADLGPGDVAIVSQGHAKSEVTCATAPAGRPLPSPFTFNGTVSLKYLDQLNARAQWCAANQTAEVNQALANATKLAQQKCASFEYPNCTLAATGAVVFTPFGAVLGDFGCEVSVNVVGTTSP